MGSSDFTPHVENIGNVLGRNDNWFDIPRYQRDYAWDKRNIKTFYDDIVSRIGANNTNLSITPYFLGTILLLGKWDDSHKRFDVIDGQQRLTTMYLFLGAMMRVAEEVAGDGSNSLSQEDRDTLHALASRILKQKLKTQDIKESDIKNTVQINTGSDLFEDLIFGKGDAWHNQHPCCDAEKKLIEAYAFFYKNLTPEELSKNIVHVDGASYAEYLNAVYEQVMYPTVIIIAVSSEETINEIFEAINSKGKHLDSVDLVKNAIFNKLSSQPQDEAKKEWGKIKENLSKESKGLDDEPWLSMAEFFKLFWTATQSGRGSDLYQKFENVYGNASVDELKDFVHLATRYSKVYADMNGLSNYFVFQKDYREYVKSDLIAMKELRFTQAMALVSTLVWAYEQNKIKARFLVETLDFLLAFSIICSMSNTPSNKLTKLYKKWAKSIFHVSQASGKNMQDVANCVKEMKEDLAKILPEWSKKDVANALKEQIKDFLYTNKTVSPDYNSKAKIRVRAILRILFVDSVKKWDIPANYSWNIEHIIPDEDSNESSSGTHQLGNLIWLEKQINSESGNDDPASKAIRYKESRNRESKQILVDKLPQRLAKAKKAERDEIIAQRSVDIMWRFYNFVYRENPSCLKD